MSIRRTIVISLCMFVFLTLSFCAAGEITARILQFKMNRLYFPVGEEENIFRDSPFVICLFNDTIYQGRIEASFPGISYSYPVDSVFDTAAIDTCYGIIEAAEIDSLSPINIGILKSLPYGDFSNASGILAGITAADSQGIGFSRYGTTLNTHLYNSWVEMQIDFESGLIDAVCSFDAVISPGIIAETISAPAPFYVALIPNVSRTVNKNGLLTTSLYYRFNEDRLYALFNGRNAEPFRCLYLTDAPCPRAYEFDPDKGRNLLNYLKKRPRKVKIAYENSTLKRLAQYFADILSRDKINVKLTTSFSDADIYISYVPLHGEKIDTSLYYIMDILTTDTTEGNPMNSNVSITANYLELQRGSSDPETRTYYLNLAQRDLREYLGVFPLLRPTVYFAAGGNLKGYSFNRDGRLELKDLRKIRLPDVSSGDNR
jgi:hypothetical protein